MRSPPPGPRIGDPIADPWAAMWQRLSRVRSPQERARPGRGPARQGSSSQIIHDLIRGIGAAKHYRLGCRMRPRNPRGAREAGPTTGSGWLTTPSGGAMSQKNDAKPSDSTDGKISAEFELTENE